MFENEDHHWWFQGTRAVILDVAREALTPRGEKDIRILDVGCGTGATLRALSSFGEVHGVEPDPGAVAHCLARGLSTVVEGRAEQLPFEDNSFDVVVALDVLEHLEDDRRAMLEMKRVLREGGTLVLTVPAFPFLWSAHDEALHHLRRYRKTEILALLEVSGFRTEKCSYYNAFLFPIVAAVRLSQRFRRSGAPVRSDVQMPNSAVNRVLQAVLSSERWVLRRSVFPVGVSLIALAHTE